MRKLLLVLLILLVACTPAVEQKPAPVIPAPDVKVPVTAPVKFIDEPVTRTVKQTGGLGTFVYGLSEDNRVLRIEKTGALWKYKYENGVLVEIIGPESIEFFYNQSRLASIDSGATKLQFMYDSRNRLVEVKGAQETLHFDYDSVDQIRGVRRGVAGETSIDYYPEGNIKYLTRGKVTTSVFYDDKNRLRNLDADDTKFIIGYWRDDKLISLSGKTFGRGLSVSYGPDYPPFEADIISAADNSKFIAAYTDTLYKVVDEYVYCKYVRTLKGILFEGLSYAFYVNYFKGDIAGYLAMQYRCITYES